MTSKATRNSRLQADLERNREEGNWRKVIELAEQLKSQNISGQDSQLATLLLGEGKLELYLEEHPPVSSNFKSAKTGLSEARNLLNQCVGDHDKKMTVSLDALLLLAKLEYATGDYSGSLTHLNNAGLDKLHEKTLTTRSLKIVAESFAIKGLCLEQTSLNRTSRYKKHDRLSKTTRCFELASDLTLLYLQKQDKISSTPSTTSLPSLSTSTNTGGSSSPLPPVGDSTECNLRVGTILESCLHRAPTLHLKAGNLQQAIDRHRLLLSAIECSGTQQLRLTVSMQLAELLMNTVSCSSYIAPALPSVMLGLDASRVSKTSTGSATAALLTGVTASASFSGEGAWRPRRYAGVNLFVPETRGEEVILLLLMSEAMAVRDAVLSQSPEFRETRDRANTAATAIHDMLAVALAPARHYQILVEVYERSMKFSWGCSHVWRQFGLALCCGRQPLRGVRVLTEAHRLQPENAIVCLVAAKVSFQSLGQIDEGIEWVKKAEQALALSSNGTINTNTTVSSDSVASAPLLSSQQLLAKCLLYRGIGLVLKAQHATVYSAALEYRKQAMALLLRASEVDPGDHLCQLYLSECYASCRQLPEAVHHVRTALSLRPDHLTSLLLLLLLLEAQGEAEEALQLVSGVQREYPRSLQVVSVAVALQERVLGAEVALQSATHMMALWHMLYQHQISGEGDAAEVASGRTATHLDAHSMFNASEDNDDVSVCGAGGVESVSRVEFALSEVASSVSGSHCPKPGPQQAWAQQIHCWLTTARLYLKLDQTSEAAQCVQEASAIFPMNHQIMFMKGQVYESKGELQEAQACYENALAVNPHHTTSLRHLGIVYQQQGSSRLAEKTLLDAVKIDPLDHDSWCALGEVTHSLGELERSSECLITALDLQRTAPVMPFATLLPCFY